MRYTEIIPGERLRPYVQCYYTFESLSRATLDDTVFPGGHMELIFNLGDGAWQSATNEGFRTTPPVELWGKLTQPLAIRSVGPQRMLGIRFFPHSATYFLPGDISGFNDQIADARTLFGAPVRMLHQKLLETPEQEARITLIEDFLWAKLAARGHRLHPMLLIDGIVHDMNEPDRMTSIARRYNISPRYLQKLFLRYTGVNPKLYQKINRFQQSLQQLAKDPSSLTSVAYECGYFDQAHFIRDFKQFAGITPSAYSLGAYPVGQALASQ